MVLLYVTKKTSVRAKLLFHHCCVKLTLQGGNTFLWFKTTLAQRDRKNNQAESFVSVKPELPPAL